jgi:hypothetical protein
MSRFGRRAAEFAVRLLQLMTVAAVLLAVLAVVWLRETPGPAPAARQPDPAPPPVERATAARLPAVDNRPPPEKPDLKGPTRFVRRLEAGELLRELEVPVDACDADLRNVALRLGDLLPALLHADYYRPYRRESRGHLANILEYLTYPPRDLHNVHLFQRDPDDPLGQHKLVRVWTLGEGYAEAELRRAEETLRHIAGVAQVDLPNGVDVLITPMMGQDVFPGQRPYSWAVGTYYLRDRYCVVKSRLAPAFREVVVKHELMHAYFRQFAKSFISSRFVSEGLAEYLRLCRPGDHGFHVPPERLQGHLARLLRMLEESRIPLRELQPRLLVQLTPRQFYALRSLSYLLAQASMAYIGGNVIERAFRDRSDRAIVDAVGAISWYGFIRFVERHAKVDARSMTVEDVGPGPQEEWDRSPDALRETLRALGVERPDKIDPATLVARPELLVEAEQIAEVLAALCEPGPTPVIFTDVSLAMDREIALAEAPEALLLYQPARASTPRGFVTILHRVLCRLHPGPAELPVVALARKPLAYPFESVARFTTEPFFHHLRTRAREPRLILCIASRMISKRARRELAASFPPPEFARPELLLVVDLSDGSGDALPLAHYMARGARFGSRIAYWNPIRR